MLPGHDSEYSERVEQGAPKRLGDLQGRDRKVDFAVLDHVEESIAAALDKPYFHLRMPPPIQGQDLRHRRLEELRCRTHSKDTALTAAERHSALSKRLGLGEQAAAACQHFATVGGEGDAPSDPIEQLNAEKTLEFANLAGQGRLAHVKPPSGERHAASLSDRHEVCHPSQVHAAP